LSLAPADLIHTSTDPPCTIPEPTRRLIRQRELFDRLAVSSATGHRLVSAGKIGPRPIRLSVQTLRYDLVEVLAWLRHRRPDGSLHDVRTWPAVWASLEK
jgi:predicted DNA-binding transcriptional regulator AlpA